ncbi:YdcF family protein [Treponema sp. OMZ 840]|uniref:SanA/YdcF family protein n=1 Tax=Treponema sp. OMZ 840 TaxID=244313 RepID=UPI003D8B3187
MIKKILRACFIFIVCIVLFSAVVNTYMVFYAKAFVYDSFDELKKSASDKSGYTALVLGAMVHGNKLSTVLQDRVDTGIDCYKKGITDGFCTTLLLSGDHGKKWYDEVNAMRLYVLRTAPGIDRTRIFLDHAGFDTYDSLYRAKNVFQAERIIVITQRFHTYRAVYIGRKLGLNVYALALSENKYAERLRSSWAAREYLARVKAFADTAVQRKPRFLGEPIPVSGSGLKTWDIFEDK